METLRLEFTQDESLNLADLLEGLNKPVDHKGHDPVLRRLTDALWALGNDTDEVVIATPAPPPYRK